MKKIIIILTLIVSTLIYLEIKNNEVNILRNGIISKENIEEVIRK